MVSETGLEWTDFRTNGCDFVSCTFPIVGVALLDDEDDDKCLHVASREKIYSAKISSRDK